MRLELTSYIIWVWYVFLHRDYIVAIIIIIIIIIISAIIIIISSSSSSSNISHLCYVIFWD